MRFYFTEIASDFVFIFSKIIMPVNDAGIKYNLNTSNILKINSPRTVLGGPHTVVYKSNIPRFAIVTIDWHKKPSFGIRWFYGNLGYPNSRGWSTWMVVPELVTDILLNYDFRKEEIKGYLKGSIKADDFKKLSQ